VVALISTMFFLSFAILAYILFYSKNHFSHNDVYLEDSYYTPGTFIVLKKINDSVYGFLDLDDIFLHITMDTDFYSRKKRPNSIYGYKINGITQEMYLGAFVLSYKDVIVNKVRRRLYKVCISRIGKIYWVSSMHINHKATKNLNA
jgi:hypothetical protein